MKKEHVIFNMDHIINITWLSEYYIRLIGSGQFGDGGILECTTT